MGLQHYQPSLAETLSKNELKLAPKLNQPSQSTPKRMFETAVSVIQGFVNRLFSLVVLTFGQNQRLWSTMGINNCQAFRQPHEMGKLIKALGNHVNSFFPRIQSKNVETHNRYSHTTSFNITRTWLRNFTCLYRISYFYTLSFKRNLMLTKHLKCRAVFRTESNIYDGAFTKKSPSQIFDWVLNTSLKCIKTKNKKTQIIT